MSAAVAVAIEQALVARLNAAVAAGEVSQEFVADNNPQPERDLQKLEKVRVLVTTAEQVHGRLTRGMTRRDVSIGIGAIKRIGFDESGNLSPRGREGMLLLAEELGDIMAQPLPGFERCGPDEPQVIYDTDDELTAKGLFSFWILATYVTTSTRRAG